MLAALYLLFEVCTSPLQDTTCTHTCRKTPKDCSQNPVIRYQHIWFLVARPADAAEMACSSDSELGDELVMQVPECFAEQQDGLQNTGHNKGWAMLPIALLCSICKECKKCTRLGDANMFVMQISGIRPVKTDQQQRSQFCQLCPATFLGQWCCSAPQGWQGSQTAAGSMHWQSGLQSPDIC